MIHSFIMYEPIIHIFLLFQNTEDKQVNLGVNHFGIMIFENFSRMNTFNWSMIRKLSFKRRKLLIKLHMEAYVSSDLLLFLYFNQTLLYYYGYW